MMPHPRSAALLGLLMMLTAPQPVCADDFAMPIRAFPDRMEATFRKLKDHTHVRLVRCLDGDAKTRTVCTYKLDDYMLAMAAGAPGETNLSDVTLVCSADSDIDAAKCIVAYAVGIETVLPDVDREDRGKLIAGLFKGLDAGEAAQITRDEHRFIMQRVAGALWFNIEAE